MVKKTVGSYLDTSFERFENNEAIYDILLNQSYTYHDLNTLVNGISKGLLKCGIEAGDHIGILADNSVQWLAVFYAVCNIGAVAVLLNTGNSIEELNYSINFTDIKVLFTTREFYKKLEREKLCVSIVYFINNIDSLLADCSYLIDIGKSISDSKLDCVKRKVHQDDIATIQFTSGTTGNAKAVQTTHFNICKTADEIAEQFQYTETDKLILGAPLFHILGYVATAITAVVSGASISLISKFKTMIVLHTIEVHGCTSFHGVPTMYKYLAECCGNYDTSSLLQGMVAGADCSQEIISDCFIKLKLNRLIDFYGQSEGMILGISCFTRENYNKTVSFTFPEKIAAKLIPLEENIQTENKKIGQLIVQTNCLMRGYYQNEEATREAIKGSWLYTGDLVLLHEDKTFELKGRMGDIIIRGGENIIVSEVEKRLMEHLSVEKAVVLGIPDDIYGQEIVAFIKPVSEHFFRMQDLKDYVLESFEKMERPKQIVVVKEFPYTATGKLIKYKLLELLERKNN